MSSIQKRYHRPFNQVYRVIKDNFESISTSVSLEKEINSSMNGCNIILLVYERYSYLGKNRVSLTVLITGNNEYTNVSMVSSGGSQAVFFKINTLGEESFLNKAVEILESKLK